MQKKLYSIEEDNYLLESILSNSNKNIKSISSSAYEKFNKVRTLDSYVMRIHNLRSYILGKGLEKIAPTHIRRIDNFLKNHSTERFISQLESI